MLISNDKGNLEFNNEGFVVTGDKSTVVISPNNSSVFAIKNSDNNYILHINDEGNLVVTGDIIATSLKMEDGSIVEGINVGDIKGLSSVAISGSYNDLKDKPARLSEFENDKLFISDDTDTLKNYYKKSEVDNLLNSKVNTDSISTVATTGSYNDLVDINELKNWVLEQIQSAMS